MYRYQLVPHMIKKEALCGHVDFMEVEWHERMMAKEDIGAGMTGLIAELEHHSCGVHTHLRW